MLLNDELRGCAKAHPFFLSKNLVHQKTQFICFSFYFKRKFFSLLDKNNSENKMLNALEYLIYFLFVAMLYVLGVFILIIGS